MEPDVVAQGWPRTSPESHALSPAPGSHSSGCSLRGSLELPLLSVEEALPYRLRAVRTPYTPHFPVDNPSGYNLFRDYVPAKKAFSCVGP